MFALFLAFAIWLAYLTAAHKDRSPLWGLTGPALCYCGLWMGRWLAPRVGMSDAQTALSAFFALIGGIVAWKIVAGLAHRNEEDNEPIEGANDEQAEGQEDNPFRSPRLRR